MRDIGDFKDMVGALVHAQGKATTASASGEACVWCDGEGKVRPDPEDAASEDDCEHCNGTGRAPSPSREAAGPLFGFDRDELNDVADGLDCYEKTVNVGAAIDGERDVHLESTTAYAARFIRAALAQQSAAPGLPCKYDAYPAGTSPRTCARCGKGPCTGRAAQAQAGGSDARDAALEDAAKVAERFGPSRPIADVRPSERIQGRWEGEQAASSTIAALIRGMKSARAAITAAGQEGGGNADKA